MADSVSYLENIPEHVLALILSFLPFRERLQLRQLNAKFDKVIMQPSVIGPLHANVRSAPHLYYVFTTTRLSGCLQKLSIIWNDFCEIDRFCEIDSLLFPNMTSLCITLSFTPLYHHFNRRETLSDNAKRFIQSPELNEMDISSDEAHFIAEILKHSTKLKHIALNRVLRLSEYVLRLPEIEDALIFHRDSLETLDLSNTNGEGLSPRNLHLFANLHSLRICPHPDWVLRKVSLPHLTSMYLTFNRHEFISRVRFTGEMVWGDVMRKWELPGLELLDVDFYCPSALVQAAPNITTFQLHFMYVKDLISWIKPLKMLHHLKRLVFHASEQILEVEPQSRVKTFLDSSSDEISRLFPNIYDIYPEDNPPDFHASHYYDSDD